MGAIHKLFRRLGELLPPERVHELRQFYAAEAAADAARIGRKGRGVTARSRNGTSLPATMKEAREAAKLLPRQAAKKLGLTPVYLSHLEAGLFEPPYDVLRRMARAYGAPALATWFEEERADG